VSAPASASHHGTATSGASGPTIDEQSAERELDRHQGDGGVRWREETQHAHCRALAADRAIDRHEAQSPGDRKALREHASEERRDAGNRGDGVPPDVSALHGNRPRESPADHSHQHQGKCPGIDQRKDIGSLRVGEDHHAAEDQGNDNHHANGESLAPRAVQPQAQGQMHASQARGTHNAEDRDANGAPDDTANSLS
jgi:hypothetical protein